MAVLALGIGSGFGLVHSGVSTWGRLLQGLVGAGIGGVGGYWGGGALFGEDSDGQKLTTLGGVLIGDGLATWSGGRWFNARHQIKKVHLRISLG